MYVKESVILAEKEAKQMSIEHPDITYCVMDKKRKTACCHCSQWAIREKILDGWYCVCYYTNGERRI